MYLIYLNILKKLNIIIFKIYSFLENDINNNYGINYIEWENNNIIYIFLISQMNWI
jgi:hypothetical protein